MCSIICSTLYSIYIVVCIMCTLQRVAHAAESVVHELPVAVADFSCRNQTICFLHFLHSSLNTQVHTKVRPHLQWHHQHVTTSHNNPLVPLEVTILHNICFKQVPCEHQWCLGNIPAGFCIQCLSPSRSAGLSEAEGGQRSEEGIRKHSFKDGIDVPFEQHKRAKPNTKFEMKQKA